MLFSNLIRLNESDDEDDFRSNMKKNLTTKKSRKSDDNLMINLDEGKSLREK
jgi:hypothetical protein